MNLFGLLDISASALTAERTRAEVIAVNMANAETTRTASGGPYVRQQVVFAADDAPGSISGGAFGRAMATSGMAVSAIAVPTMASAGRAGEARGVRIAALVADKAPPIERYDPQHPDADKNGFVAYPDINPLTEMVDLMGASRAYGLNSSAVQATKSMINTSLELLK